LLPLLQPLADRLPPGYHFEVAGTAAILAMVPLVTNTLFGPIAVAIMGGY
jgi:hypothetical protein